MQEIWKSTINSNGWYEVSSLGRVRSWSHSGPHPKKMKKPKLLRPNKLKTGYATVNVIHITKKRRTQTIHKIVLDVFVGVKKQGFECDHINHNRADNRLSNLRWVNHKENMKNRVKAWSSKGHRSMPPNVQTAIKELSREIFCV